MSTIIEKGKWQNERNGRMSIIDTHAHLFVKEFHEDIDNVVARARAAGVHKVLLPNISDETIEDLKSCIARYPGFFYPMMGLHPTDVTKEWRRQLDRIHEELTRKSSSPKGNYIAVGEVGIDLYWDDSLKQEQIQVFEQQLEWSRELDLPVSIHFRNATIEVVESIRRVGEHALRGVFHSFGGDREELELILSLENFLIGVNGVVTFKNSGLVDTLKDCPRNRVVVETDSPYLAPVPYRGKRNESSYLPFIIHKIAEAWEVEAEAVKEITTQNADALFGLGNLP